MGARGELAVLDAARVHAGAAHADQRLAAGHAVEHALDVVEALRHRLPRLRARSGVADEEHAHRLFLRARQHRREAQRVVAALRAVRRLVEDEQSLAHLTAGYPDWRTRS